MTTTKQRSPNYPMWGLNEAKTLLDKLYVKEKRGEFPPESVTGAWGYKSFSGPVRARFSTMKHYGLIDQKKGAGAKLSERALTLVLRNPASMEYKAALKEAALEPSLFREYYEQGRIQSSDDTLKHDLIVNRRFTDNGADDFIKAFRDTMAFAGLTEGGIISGQEDEEEPSDEEIALSMTQENITIPVILPSGKQGRVIIPVNMSDDDWRRLDRVLNAYRPEQEKDARPSETTPSH
jgi:hypothetical protein